MIQLSAFADEISADLDEQIAVLQGEHIAHIDLRGVWGTNVLDLSDEQVNTIKVELAAHGIKVAAIASPLGKVPVDDALETHMERFERAITLAHTFQTPYIRLFSFYPPASTLASADTPDAPDKLTMWRDGALQRLHRMASRAQEERVMLLHENEKDIYGDTITHCVDLLESIHNEHFQAAFDPANFIQCAQTPYPDAYAKLRPWIRYMHVKDALADGSVVPAGEGLARWPELLHSLRNDGYDGFFSLEPHLAAAGQYQGFSGPDLFRRASQALQKMLQEMNWEYR